MLIPLCAIGAFCLGSLNASIWISKHFYRRDIRFFGSQNPGTTNTLHTFGAIPALFVFLFDFGKAFLPVYCIQSETHNLWLAVLVALLVILGHCFSVFHNFQGGKGVACAFGAVCALAPTMAIPLLVICAVLSLALHHVFLSPVVTAAMMIPMLCIYAAASGTQIFPFLVFSAGVFSVLFNRHLPQINKAFHSVDSV